jgi:hypothetical protein
MKIGVLTEFKDKEAPYFDPTTGFENLKYPGLIAWNTSDERVGYKEAVDFSNNLFKLKAPLDTVSYSTGGHSVVGNLDYVVKFLEN